MKSRNKYTKDDVFDLVKELSKRYNKKEIVMKIMIKHAIEEQYTILEIKEIIQEFYLSKTCPK